MDLSRIIEHLLHLSFSSLVLNIPASGRHTHNRRPPIHPVANENLFQIMNTHKYQFLCHMNINNIFNMTLNASYSKFIWQICKRG